MIRLYSGSGSQEVELDGMSQAREEWVDIRRGACDLLRIRGAKHAAKLLEEIPFDLYDGTNLFGDKFSLLYLNTSVKQYVKFEEQSKDFQYRAAYKQIADTFLEIGSPIRFVVVNLEPKSSPEAVTTPILAITSDVVEEALADCEQLIQSRGATSGVDRIHTVFHGYLRAVCKKSYLEINEDAGVTQLFKKIREQHPSFIKDGARGHDIDRIVNAMATIIDSLNPLRNKATLAHPNDAVLEEGEAMLVINSVRSLLHYLNMKLY